MNLQEPYLTIVTVGGGLIVGIGGFTLAFFAVLKAYRWYDARAEQGLMKLHGEFRPSPEPDDGLVSFRYHTYSGLLFWFLQTEHAGYLHPDDARAFLKALRNYNLRWGLLTHGAFFAPFLIFGNYWDQLRSIKKQETTMRTTPSSVRR